MRRIKKSLEAGGVVDRVMAEVTWLMISLASKGIFKVRIVVIARNRKPAAYHLQRGKA
jgi:RNA 3'-terminal phosphate cyclase